MLTLPHVASGKVRELYEIDADHLLFVATNRISAYDVILATEIPDKGTVLTGLSEFWFGLLETPHHFVTADIGHISGAAEAGLDGRAMVVRRADVVPMECVVRGYLYGSAWREYAAGGGPTTEHLPPGLRLADELSEPIFTPATKAETGHDENLDEAGARALVGDDLYEELRSRSIAIYRRAQEHAADRGVLLADTKFEFGFIDGELCLIDEVLTPDSSRYWPADAWQPGSDVPSFDKQFVRDWLDSTGWDRTPPSPELPADVVANTRAKYITAFQLLTDTAFEPAAERSV